MRAPLQAVGNHHRGWGRVAVEAAAVGGAALDRACRLLRLDCSCSPPPGVAGPAPSTAHASRCSGMRQICEMNRCVHMNSFPPHLAVNLARVLQMSMGMLPFVSGGVCVCVEERKSNIVPA